VQKIQEFIGNVNATALGAVGSVLLFSVAIRLLMTIELSFNDIWGVRTGRSIWRKIVYYWTAITLGPLLLVTAMVITGSMEFSGAAAKLAMAASFGKVLAYLAPFVVLWVAFGLMYALMPNTHVRPRAAIIGGMLGGTLWQANSLLSTLYLSRVVTYSKIYGSLGIVPVLLVGLYFSWWIVLFGAQVSFTVQNLRAFLLRRASEKLNQQQREAIACRTVLLACQHFVRGANPPTMQEACDQLGVSQALLNQIVQRLVDGGVLSVIADEGRALQPARPPDALTLADVLRVMRGSGGRSGRPDDVVEKLLSDLCAAEQSSPSNVAFAELVAKLDSQVTIPFRSR
jgi:membrane protein